MSFQASSCCGPEKSDNLASCFVEAGSVQKEARLFQDPFLQKDNTTLAGRKIVLVHGAGDGSFMGNIMVALNGMGASVTIPHMIHENPVDWATSPPSGGALRVAVTTDIAIDALVDHLNTLCDDSNTVVDMVAHSWGGVPMTYAALRTDMRCTVGRVVYYGAPMPDTTVNPMEGYADRSYMGHPPFSEAIKKTIYDALGPGLEPHSANAYGLSGERLVEQITTFPPELWSGPIISKELHSISTLQGKTTTLVGLNDWSLGITLEGVNRYLREPGSHQITPRVIIAPGDHFTLVFDAVLASQYFYHSLKKL